MLFASRGSTLTQRTLLTVLTAATGGSLLAACRAPSTPAATGAVPTSSAPTGAAPTPLAAVCRCSAEGVDAMLRSFSAEEVKHMIGDDGLIGVTCEFCSTKRVFSPASYGA